MCDPLWETQLVIDMLRCLPSFYTGGEEGEGLSEYSPLMKVPPFSDQSLYQRVR